MTRPEGAPAAGGTAGQAQGQEQHQHCGERLFSTPTAEKRLSDYRARLAFRGHQLHQLADGTFLACRWDCSRMLPTLEAVAAFVRLVEGGTR
jgi:hypothetical protein